MNTKDPFLNRQIDEYRIEGLLGVGGMARVYRGVDVRLKRYVAVKVIDFPHHNDTAYVARFEREAQVIAQLSHPNIVPLYRYGEIDEYLYMVMQYIDGSDLYTVLSSYRADREFMDYKDVIRIMEGICQALDYVHQKGVIHRDLKPSNILLSKDGRPVLSDFGLALITQVGTLGEVFGSPHYMAPEQAVSSAQAVPRSDLYSLGVILYEIITGQLPFRAEDPVEVAMQHIRQPVPAPRGIRPEISPQIEEILLRAMAKDPEDRYPDGATFAAAFKDAVHAPQEAIRPPSTASRLSVPERVRLQSASKPLPPLKKPDPEPVKEVVKEPAKAEQAGHQQKATPSAAPRYLVLILISVILLCCAGIAFLCVSGLMFGSQMVIRALVSESRTTPVTRVAPLLGITTTPSPNIIVTPTRRPAILYKLRIIKRREDGFFLLNEGEVEFPLASLQLGNPPVEIEGSVWGIENLNSRECVAVTRQGAKLKKPKEIDCVQVGGEVETASRYPFWKDTFLIFYQGEYVEMCRGDIEECELEIPAAP